MSYKRSVKPVLKPMTIRFSVDAWDAIEKLAKRHNVNKTELIRTALAGNLANYFGTIRIIDKEQAAEIRTLIKELFDEISAVKTELHRIGINYNQEIRLRQIERKYANMGTDLSTINRKFDEVQAVKKECKEFSPKDIDELIARYEKATEKVGKMLCRILA